jgi:ribonuclease T2
VRAGGFAEARRRSAVGAWLAAAALLLALSPASAGGDPGGFDYYVLSLSWSPHFCSLPQAREETLQCAERRYGFVVHGLWPQRKGGAPSFCNGTQPRQVKPRIVDEYLSIMPSPRLMGHQWRKHGTCTGLSQEDYFAAIGRAWSRFRVPRGFHDGDLVRTNLETLLARIVEANPGLPRESLVLGCRGREFAEARICLSHQLEPVACGSEVPGNCPRDGLRVRPAR